MSIFNKTLLGKNIKFLAAKKGIKVGDLESQVEVSAGYFSRLANDDGKNSSTLVDTICKVAERLGISVNTLISTDISALTPNETLLSKFFDKLGKDTSEGILVWERESKKRLDGYLVSGDNALFGSYASLHKEGRGYLYRSRFDSDVETAGDMHKVIVNKKWLYLFKVKKQGSTDTGFEIYFYLDDNHPVEKICNAYPESDLYNQIADLYNVAAESSRHVKLSDSVIGTINGYMDIQFPEDIEF